MTRQYESRQVLKETLEHVTDYYCDKCGKSLNRDDEVIFPHELVVLLNKDECVSYRFRLDLCIKCLEPIWTKICATINRDPDDISGSDFE